MKAVAAAVGFIREHGTTDAAQMDADLVRPARCAADNGQT